MFGVRKYKQRINELELELSKYKRDSTNASIGEELGFIMKDLERVKPEDYAPSMFVYDLLIVAGMVSAETLEKANSVWRNRNISNKDRINDFEKQNKQ